jgi:hypothetical protein
MQTLKIDICNPKAEQLLYDLAQLDLIVIHSEQEDWERRCRRKAGWAKGTFVIHPTPDEQRPPAGYGKGKAVILPSFYDPLEEFEEYE